MGPVAPSKMSTELQLQALEFHGSCTEAGVLLIAPPRVAEVGDRGDEGEGDAMGAAALVLSEMDGLLHAPTSQYRRNEGLTACAARGLYDWTSGALVILPERLAAAPIVCSGTAVFFVLYLDPTKLEEAAAALSRNVARDLLRGSRHPKLPRALLQQSLGGNGAAHALSGGTGRLPANIGSGTAAALLQYTAAVAPRVKNP
jgi:hypothetical protein